MSDFRLKHSKTLRVSFLLFPPLFHCNWSWLGSQSGCAEEEQTPPWCFSASALTSSLTLTRLFGTLLEFNNFSTI